MLDCWLTKNLKNQFIENFQKAKYTDNFLSYAPAIFAASTVNKQSGLVGWNSLSFNLSILMPMPSARRNFIFAGEKKFRRQKVKFRPRKINFMK